MQLKKVIPLTQIYLCTFFCNSAFPSWFLSLIVLQQETRKTHQRPYDCVSEITIKYRNSTNIINTKKL